MVELDYETSFGRYLDPDQRISIPTCWPTLCGISRLAYEDIKKLNQHYREKAESFDKVEPPRNFSQLETKDLPKVSTGSDSGNIF